METIKNIFNIKNIDFFKINFNLKHIYISLDELIVNSLSYGNIHFFITINFHNKLFSMNLLEKKIVSLQNLILKKIDFVSWFIVFSEKHKDGSYHLHLVLSVRSFIGYNDCIQNNILFFLRNNYEIDTDVKVLWNFNDIKKSLRYVFKNLEKKNIQQIENYFGTNILNICCIEFQCFLFKYLSNYFNLNYFFYSDTSLLEDVSFKKYDLEYANFIGYFQKNNSYFYNNEKGIKVDLEKKYSDIQIIYVWNMFLLVNNIYIYNNNLYKKVENYLISYNKIFNITVLWDDFLLIIDSLEKNYPIHFKNFDKNNFFSKFLKNKSEKFEKLLNFTKNILYPDFNFMEFKDGVYSITLNKFFKKDKFLLNNSKISTIKYYNITYKHLSEPTVWLNSVKKVLGLDIEKKDENFLFKCQDYFMLKNTLNELLIYIAYVFHNSSNMLHKKSTLYIWGPSNTGKTTLIINLFINYFGSENVGLLSSNKNFSYQNLIDKLIFIFDEFDLSQIKSEDFKKIVNKELILSEQKNKDAILLNPSPVIISSNENIEHNFFITNKESIINRLKIINFSNPISENNVDSNINTKIKDEEAKIIIYCNKAYFAYIENLKIEK